MRHNDLGTIKANWLLIITSMCLYFGGFIAPVYGAVSKEAPVLPAMEGDVMSAYQTLLTTETFAGSQIGYDGHLSEQVRAFRLLLAQDSAREIFRQLFQDAGVAGQLYALSGLYLVDREYFNGALEIMRAQSSTVVRTQFGCLGGSMTVGEVLQSQAPNAVRLAPGQSVSSWLQAHDGTGELDIIGGGYPAEFSVGFSSR